MADHGLQLFSMLLAFSKLLLNLMCREEKEEWMPIDSAPYGSTSAFYATSTLLHEVVAALNSLNIKVEQIEIKLNIIYSYSRKEILCWSYLYLT